MILDYFSSATQIGLTATPKETVDVSTTHYFGEAVYTYSLVLEQRTALVARKVTEFLKATDRFDKTIVFCEDIESVALVPVVPSDRREGRAPHENVRRTRSPIPLR